MNLDDSQCKAFDAVKRGDNVFITGEAGCGKTFLVSHILNYLRSRYSNNVIGITATTGIAAKLLGGKTLHSLLGLPIGTLDFDKFKQKLRAKNYLNTRWKKLKVLIIDEISMLSADLFEFIDKVAKYVRRNGSAFGGIQIIAVGDFFQLSPVKGEFCFTSKVWDRAIDESIVLKCNYRQKDDVYSRLCNEFRTSTLSEESLAILNTLSSKSFDNSHRPTSLYCKNKDVDAMNKKELRKLNGVERTFISKDSEAEKCNNLFYVKNQVTLKLGAQVMLLKNKSEELVNGSIGTVTDMDDESVTVDFYGHGKTVVQYEQFEAFDEYNNTIITRSQIPLTLAYSMTIHKSQGQSIDVLEIDFEGCFNPGQAYVAISRGRNIKNLYIKNFNKDTVIVDPKVVAFYNKLEAANPQKRKFYTISKYFTKS